MAAILVTGAAGFIGSHVIRLLLERGETIVGLDNMNAYYDPELKRRRVQALEALAGADRFRFEKIDLVNSDAVASLVAESNIDRVVHLGAQAGVRWSLEAPFAYTASNVTGHLSVLEAVRQQGDKITHMVYASTSSVYGSRTDGPFRETDRIDRPASLYAATKIADELMSTTYAQLYGLPLTGLRFFTVYGPWGRPDMAYWLFTDAMLKGRPIKLFNNGDMLRDFTYVDDIVAGIVAALDKPGPRGEHRIYNIGNNNPEPLAKLVSTLETYLGVTAVKELLPMQQGDVPATYADISAMQRDFGWRPTTSLESGLEKFVAWWHDYHGTREG